LILTAVRERRNRDRDVVAAGEWARQSILV
jgi:hypothetical protein